VPTAVLLQQLRQVSIAGGGATGPAGATAAADSPTRGCTRSPLCNATLLTRDAGVRPS
jgi:hypothetical protein